MSTPMPTPAQPQGPAAVDADQSGTSSAAPHRTRRNLLWGGLLGGALVVGGGTAFAVTTLSGGGAQPDEVLPGNAIAYVRMDIDPSAGQKIAAVRLLRKLPRSTTRSRVAVTRGRSCSSRCRRTRPTWRRSTTTGTSSRGSVTGSASP